MYYLLKQFSLLYFQLYTMSLKKQLSYLKKAQKLVKQKKLEIKNNILKKNVSILFKDKSDL